MHGASIAKERVRLSAKQIYKLTTGHPPQQIMVAMRVELFGVLQYYCTTHLRPKSHHHPESLEDHILPW